MKCDIRVSSLGSAQLGLVFSKYCHTVNGKNRFHSPCVGENVLPSDCNIKNRIELANAFGQCQLNTVKKP